MGLTQEALAERLELATKNVQRIESGAQNLTLATLERIAQALETSPAALVAANGGASERANTRAVRLHDARLLLEGAGFRVRPASSPGRRSPQAVPLTTIRAAAGSLSGAGRAVEVLAWVMLPRKGPPPEGQFIAQITGDSMAPRIVDGAVCLFGRPGGPPFRERTFLVRSGSLGDEGMEGPFALKQIEARRRHDLRGVVVLRSLNPRHAPIEVDASELDVVAELLDVLVTPSSASDAPGS